MAAGRYGLQVADIQSVVASAIGGENIGETIENRQRFPINVRYPREYRDSLERLRALPIVTERGAQIRLSDVAKVEIRDGPPMLKSENGRLSGWVYVDIRGRDLRSAVTEMQQRVAREVKLPPGYSISWSGQFEYLERATQRLKVVVPATLAVIFLLLFLTFRSAERGAADHGRGAVRAGRRLLVHLAPGARHVGGERGRIHRAGRCRGGIRRRDAGLPQECVGAPLAARRAVRSEATLREAIEEGAVLQDATEGDDGGGHLCRPAAHHVERGHRGRSHAADCRADGRRHGHGTAAVAARDSSRVAADDASRASQAQRRGGQSKHGASESDTAEGSNSILMTSFSAALESLEPHSTEKGTEMKRIVTIVVLAAVSMGVQVAAAQAMKDMPMNVSPTAGTHTATGTVKKGRRGARHGDIRPRTGREHEMAGDDDGVRGRQQEDAR